MQRTLLAIPFVVTALLAGCASEGAGEASVRQEAVTTAVLEPYECGEITRLHTFDGIFLASQPTPLDLEHARDGGVRTVVNLRHEDEITDFDERQVVADLGLEYVSLPFKKPEELTDEVFDHARALLSTGERPLMMHCSSSNRVGAVWIAWRALEGGLSLDEAVAEAKVVGLRSPVFEELARAYVEARR